MTRVVDLRHVLTPTGEPLETRGLVRSNALRFLAIVEHGAGLAPGHARETPVECLRRPRGKRCSGQIWVAKVDPEAYLWAVCRTCDSLEAVISNWQGTRWARGLQEPVPLELGRV